MDMRTLLMLAGGGGPEMSYGEPGVSVPAPVPPPTTPPFVPGLAQPPTGIPQTLADFLQLRERTMGDAAARPMAPQARDMGILMAGLGMMQPWQKGRQTAAGALGESVARGVGAAQKEDTQLRAQGAEDFRTIMEGMRTVGSERRADRADVRAEKTDVRSEAESDRSERRLRIEGKVSDARIKALEQEYEKDKLELEVLQNKKTAGLTTPQELKRMRNLEVEVTKSEIDLRKANAEYARQGKDGLGSAQSQYVGTLKKLYKEMHPTTKPEDVAKAVWDIVNSGKSDTLKAAIAIYEALDSTKEDKDAALDILRKSMGRLGRPAKEGGGAGGAEVPPGTGAGRIPFGAIQAP